MNEEEMLKFLSLSDENKEIVKEYVNCLICQSNQEQASDYPQKAC